MPRKPAKSNDIPVSDGAVSVDQVEVEVATPTSPKEATLLPLSPFDVKIAEFTPYLKLKVKDVNDSDGAKKIDDARKEVKRVKIEAEKIGKEVVAPFNEVVKAINARRNEVEGSLEKIEKYLKSECDRYNQMVEEKEKEEAKKAEEKFQNRIDQVRTIGAEWNGYSAYKIGEISASLIDIRQMTDEEFIETTGKMEEEYERQRIAKEEREAEEKARQAEQEAERNRIAAENQKLAKEKADLQKQLDAMKKQQQDALDKAAKEKADREAKEAADKAEAEAIRKQAEYNLRFSELRLCSVILNEETQVFEYEDAAVSSVEDVKAMTQEEWAEFFVELPNDIQRYKDQREEEKKAKEEADAAAEAERVRLEEAEKARIEELKPDKEKLAKLLSKLLKECSAVKPQTDAAAIVLDDLCNSISFYEDVINNLK